MAWDFETEPEFEAKLAWMRTFVRDEIIPLEALADNPQILPPTLDVAGARNDLLARDQLRPRLMRVEILLQKGNDTSMALGSDAYTVATQGYGILKLLGRANGLEPLRRDLGSRFAKSPRATAEEKKAA